MSSTLFKLTQPGGLTRRAQFHNLPSWIDLAAKIKSLFPYIQDVGVSYIDSDGDEVTFSSEEELQDFYVSNHQPGQTIKLVVQDLASARDSVSALGSATPRVQSQGNHRNTFGQDGIMGFADEDEWQTVPPGGLFGAAGSETFGGPQAYIEQLSSDAGSVRRGADSDMSSFTTDKGKGKLVDTDDVSSTASLLVSEANVKYPVHVLDVADEGMVDPPTPIIDSPTKAERTTLPSDKQANAEEADPPLPSVDAPPAPSLTNDIATFLSALTTVFSAHPELSEGLRNISRNAANGSYWNAHRQAVSAAAEEIRKSVIEESGQRAGDLRRLAEEEAGRRVADALGGLMQMFGEMRTDIQDTDAARGNPGDRARDFNNDAGNPNPFARYPHGRGRGGHGGPHRRPATWADGPPTWASFIPPPFGPPHGPHAPPPGPPPPGGPGGPGRPHHHGRFPFPGPPPPGAFGSFVPHIPPFWDHQQGRGGHRHHEERGGGAADGSGPSGGENGTEDAAELRAKVEEAKRKYKMEKEAYRRARGERKFADTHAEREPTQDAQETAQEVKIPDAANRSQPYVPPFWGGRDGKDRDGRPVLPPAPAGISQIVSNARGPYPELEMVSVPGPMARPHRRTTSAGEQEAQATKRITRRIADMGFTETAFPQLPARIRDLLATKKPTSKEAEDDVVTSLLEELLSAPQASGSGTSGSNTVRPERENVPGAWN